MKKDKRRVGRDWDTGRAFPEPHRANHDGDLEPDHSRDYGSREYQVGRMEGTKLTTEPTQTSRPKRSKTR